MHGVRNDELTKWVNGPSGAPKTLEGLMSIEKVFVEAERKVAANRSFEQKMKEPSRTNDRARNIDTSRTPLLRFSGNNGYRHPVNAIQHPVVPQPTRTIARIEPAPTNTSQQNKTHSEILQTENLPLYQPQPQPLRAGNSKDKSKYCNFHKDHGHVTDQCWQLQRQIDHVVRAGKAPHLIQGEPKEIIPPQEIIGQKRIQAIGMIHGGRPQHQTTKRPGSMLEAWMEALLVFPPVKGGSYSTEPLVITAQIGNYNIHKIFLDCGSASDIMYEHCFRQLDEFDQKKLIPVDAPLVGFAGEQIQPIGQLTLPMRLTDGPRTRVVSLSFLIVPAFLQYCVIIGRPGLAGFNAALSSAHGAIMFPTPKGPGIIYVKQECLAVAKEVPRLSGPEKWILNPTYPVQTITIGSTISDQTRGKMKELLTKNIDVFAWKSTDMIGVPRVLSQHELKVYPHSRPINEKKRTMGTERRQAMIKEVNILVEAGILREVRYQTWVANPVMVKKSSGAWRMCVDFTNLNKSCPKDAYPIPEIDLKVDSLAPFRYKCFLDAYKGYHQIQMAPEDEDKTAFHTDIGIFCYTKMSFGLKNAGATYQRLMDKAFKNQIGRNLEVYVDDIVIKSRTETDILADIQETCDRLRSFNLKLNPSKCAFGVEEGKFLGVVVTNGGFQANPEKVKTGI